MASWQAAQNHQVHGAALLISFHPGIFSRMDSTFFSPLVRNLLADNRTCALDAGQPNELALPVLREMSAKNLFSVRVRGLDAARCCLAGLWLYHDYLDESHEISQDIQTPSGSFWHGIMHRREPDPSNAAYWFRRVGEHPIFDPLAKAAQGMMDDVPLLWSPFWFIDRCTDAIRRQEPDAAIRLVQKHEWELLFDFCWREAVSS
jgi:hypothetical protein